MTWSEKTFIYKGYLNSDFERKHCSTNIVVFLTVKLKHFTPTVNIYQSFQ